jgi:hypothetical protein
MKQWPTLKWVMFFRDIESADFFCSDTLETLLLSDLSNYHSMFDFTQIPYSISQGANLIVSGVLIYA